MTNKMKILFVAANPIDTGWLQLEKEARELQARIRQGPHRDLFEVVHCLAARPQDLLDGLQNTRPYILHFSGHGTHNKEIVLQGDDGTSRPVDPPILAELISNFKNNLKLALLSSCYARRQAEALQDVLDFTIGMDKPISDEGAVSYSAAFYQVLASGGSMNQAFHGARAVTIMDGRPVFEKADLLIRKGAEDQADVPFIRMLPPAESESSATNSQSQSSIVLKNSKAGIINSQGEGSYAINTVNDYGDA